MALINLKFASEVLGMQTEINVVVPQRSTKGQIGMSGEAKGEKYKTLLLLHGLSDDASTWLRRSSIERYATENGIAVIMPGAERSFYTDMKYGAKYFTYITEELPGIVREFLNVSDKREDTYIAGLSMGGYGALKSALKKPEVFCACAGLSSVADIRCGLFDEVLVPVFGEELVI
ncbi:MAG: esterase family protein, partial [Clostridia bacterium]|nr:esterase family protein [Clostridia bacterium]